MAGEEIIIDRLHREASLLFRQQKEDEQIIQALCTSGAERHYAEQVLMNVKRDVVKRKKFRNNILYGAGFLALGLLLNLASYNFSNRLGSSMYYFFWGILVVGLGYIFRAFVVFRK